MTHLILHKVRGEPAFDVAEKMRCSVCGGVGGHNVPDFETGEITDYEGPSCDECNGEGFWWIIPTSGHRAYPYRSWEFSILQHEGQMFIGISGSLVGTSLVIPKDWPDHYQNEDTGTITSGVDVMAIVSKMLPKIKRRL